MEQFTLQDLINLINNAETITEEERKQYLGAINTGTFTAAMAKQLQEVFAHEVTNLEEKIAGWEKEIAEQETIKEKEWKKIKPKVVNAIKEGEQAMQDEVSAFKQDIADIEKKADKQAQKVIGEQEKEEIEDIRKNLGL